METITKVTARKAYERAKATGDAADWHAAAEAIWAYVNKPKVRRGRWPSVFPAPVMSGHSEACPPESALPPKPDIGDKPVNVRF